MLYNIRVFHNSPRAAQSIDLPNWRIFERSIAPFSNLVELSSSSFVPITRTVLFIEQSTCELLAVLPHPRPFTSHPTWNVLCSFFGADTALGHFKFRCSPTTRACRQRLLEPLVAL